MANDSSNGAVLTFGGSNQTDVRSFSFERSAAEIDVTTLGASTRLYESGLPDYLISAEAVGISSIAVGTKGALAITENDADTTDTGDIAQVVCVRSDVNWASDEEITTSLAFRPTTTEA